MTSISRRTGTRNKVRSTRSLRRRVVLHALRKHRRYGRPTMSAPRGLQVQLNSITSTPGAGGGRWEGREAGIEGQVPIFRSNWSEHVGSEAICTLWDCRLCSLWFWGFTAAVENRGQTDSVSSQTMLCLLTVDTEWICTNKTSANSVECPRQAKWCKSSKKA